MFNGNNATIKATSSSAAEQQRRDHRQPSSRPTSSCPVRPNGSYPYLVPAPAIRIPQYGWEPPIPPGNLATGSAGFTLPRQSSDYRGTLVDGRLLPSETRRSLYAGKNATHSMRFGSTITESHVYRNSFLVYPRLRSWNRNPSGPNWIGKSILSHLAESAAKRELPGYTAMNAAQRERDFLIHQSVVNKLRCTCKK